MTGNQVISGAMNPSEGVSNKTHPWMGMQCYLIYKEVCEPDEDEMIDDEQIFSELLFYTASSKDHALELQGQALLEEGFWELDVYGRSNAEIPEWTNSWTNDWTNVTLQIYSINESSFWEFLSWDEAFWSEELVAWARKNRALASQLLMAAKAGQGLGQQAVAKHAELLSIVEEAELEQEVPAKKGDKKSRTSSSL